MAELGGRINVDEEAKEYRGEFTVMPPGWYTAVIVKSEVRSTKNNDGKILELVFQTKKSGSELTERVNIVNKSEVAQRIGRSTLAKIAQEIGIKGELSNSNVLHGKPIDIKVTVEEFESNKEAGKMLKSNKIADYRKAGTGVNEANGASQPAAKAGSSW